MFKKILLIITFIFCILFALIGAVMPVIPAIPFWILALLCIMKFSKRFNNWFTSTRLYRTVLSGHFENPGLTAREKLVIIIMASCSCLIGYIVLRNYTFAKFLFPALWITCFIIIIAIRTVKR